MNPQKMQKYQRTLQELRDRLTDEVDHLAESIREDIRAPGEPTDLPTHNADQDAEGLVKNLALEQNETDMLAQVVAALERIEEGTYGDCINCSEPIAPARLDAIPYTPYCRVCQEQQEASASP